MSEACAAVSYGGHPVSGRNRTCSVTVKGAVAMAHDERPGRHAEGPGRTQEEMVARRLSADRERIAEDLSDPLVRLLFAVSLDLHAALSRTGDRPATEKIHSAIAGLDQAIKELRAAVFDIGRSATATGRTDPGDSRPPDIETQPVRDVAAP